MEFFIKMMCIGKRPGCQASPEIRYAQLALPPSGLLVEGFWQRSTFEHEVATVQDEIKARSWPNLNWCRYYQSVQALRLAV